jgi:small conductance mechanosensitive channel
MSFLQNMEIDLISIALRLLLVIVVLIIGRWLAGHTRGWLIKSTKRTNLTESLITLFVTLSYYGIIILTVMVALAILGVPTTTIVGIAGIVIIVLAIALQQSLGNLAATVNFLLFKPFEVGHVIQTSGVMGIVHEIELFSTVLVSADHKTHVLPNAKIQGAGLTNYSKIGTIRVDLTFSVSYESDISKAKQILVELLAEDERVLTEPPPQVFVQKLADSSIDLAAWPFVQIADFLAFQKDIAEQVKNSFDEAGIIIPYPQQDVHVSRQD